MRQDGRLSFVRICGVMLLPLICLSSLTLAQWPRFHGNSLNTGVFPGAQGRSGTYTELWVFPIATYTNSSPALADLDGDGLLEVVIGANQEALYALNGEDGSILWQYLLPGTSNSSSPVIADLDNDSLPEVVFATEDSIRILQGESGVLAWSKPVTGEMGVSPCIADLDGNGTQEVVFTENQSGSNTTAYNGETGEVLWSVASYFNSTYGSTVAEDTNLDGTAEVMAMRITPSPAFCLLDGEDGSLIWSTPVNDIGIPRTPAPAFADLDQDGYLEIVSCGGDNDLYVMNASDGSILWSIEFTTSADFFSSPCLIDLDGNDSLEIVVGLYDEQELRAYTCTGDLIWTTSVANWPLGTPAIEDIDGDQTLEIIQTSVYITAGAVQFFDAATGIEEFKISFNSAVGTSPAIGDLDGDGFYDFVFGCHNGNIYAMTSETQGIDPQSSISPFNFMISPNPFSSSASITFELSEPEYTSIQVFDLTGRMLCSLAESELDSGQHSYLWDGMDQNGEPVSSGIFLCRIQSGEISETANLCLLR